jgi:predicted alpha/beta superfamily hydrolase
MPERSLLTSAIKTGTPALAKPSARICRVTDFTAPAPDRAHYGGAPIFQNYLKEELLPLIEETYRSDASKRILFGQSQGGQFVLHTAMTDPDLFWGRIASNPALHRNLPFYMEPKSDGTQGGRLFVSSGEFNDARYHVPALQWMDHWSSAAEAPWALKTAVLPDQNHFSAGPAAFRQGLQWIFQEPSR